MIIIVIYGAPDVLGLGIPSKVICKIIDDHFGPGDAKPMCFIPKNLFSQDPDNREIVIEINNLPNEPTFHKTGVGLRELAEKMTEVLKQHIQGVQRFHYLFKFGSPVYFAV